MTVTPAMVVEYWLGLGQAAWYAVNPEVDAEIAARFGPAWEAAAAGGLDGWRADAPGTLGYLILTDQFPRNMFRGEARAFATDARALAAADAAVTAELDRDIPEPERQFFYLPFMHAEDLAAQDRGVALIAERMPQGGASNLLHARAHREVIRRFGRFPYRNAALGRDSTAAEQAFMADGGYGAVLRELGGEGGAAAP